MKKIIPTLIFFMLLATAVTAQFFTIEGKVVTPGAGPAAGVAIHISTPPGETPAIDSMLTTDDKGDFVFRVPRNENTSRLTLLVAIADCPTGAGLRRVVFTPNQAVQRVQLISCRKENTQCHLEIHASRLLDGKLMLEARYKGVNPVSWQWSTGDTTSSIIVDRKGQYCVVMEDSTGCKARDCFQYHVKDDCNVKIQMTRTNTDPASGKVVLTARAKGTPPYQYLWSTGDTTISIRPEDDGEYCVQVTDANGCIDRDCATIKPIDRECKTEIMALGTAANAISLSVRLAARTRGVPPFKYFWSTGDSTQIIWADQPGEYCVRVLDATGCWSSACYEVRRPTLCTTKIVVSPLASATNAALRLTARTAGRAPFSYKWSTGDTTQTVSVSDAGEYCVTVTDAAGCVSRDCQNIADLLKRCEVQIHRAGPGALIAQVKGGLGPFRFAWSTDDTTRAIRIDGPGEYCVSITNSLGCTASACVVIDDVAPCAVKIFRRPTAVLGQIALTARVREGSNLKFEWSTGDTTATILVDTSGEYCVTAYNDTCKVQDCVTLQLKRSAISAEPDLRVAPVSFDKVPEVLRVGPNPFVDRLNVQWKTDSSQRILLTVSTLQGDLVLTQWIDSASGFNQTEIAMPHMSAGMYVLQLIGQDFRISHKLLKSQ